MARHIAFVAVVAVVGNLNALAVRAQSAAATTAPR
jgi:hypothetical protein